MTILLNTFSKAHKSIPWCCGAHPNSIVMLFFFDFKFKIINIFIYSHSTLKHTMVLP